MWKHALLALSCATLWLLPACGEAATSDTDTLGNDVGADVGANDDTGGVTPDDIEQPQADGGATATDAGDDSPDISDSGAVTTDAAPSPDAEAPNDAATVPDPGPEPPDTCPVMADVVIPPQSGVAYVGHYHTSELRWYRTDGSRPTHAGTVDTAGYTHDMALDPVADLLAVAHDIGHSVELFQLDRPNTPASLVDPPTLTATIDLGSDAPRRVAFDVARHRLYIVGNAPLVGGELLESMLLYVYDTSDPTAPVALAEPQTIPVTTSLAIDPYAGVLGVIDTTTKELHLYDASAPTVVLRPGDPVDLRALYPQESSAGFQPRNLRFDPANGRLLAAREQTALSEVIALSYPSVLDSTEECPAQPTHDDLVVIPDGFDVDQVPQDWDNLLGAHDVIPITGSDAVMFIGEAWNGQMASSIIIPLDGSLEPQAGCGDYAGSGCFYQGYVNEAPVSYKRTDGAACIDATHGVVVGTSINESSEDEPGVMHFFRYETDLQMSPWLTESGGMLAASGLPIGAVCH